MLSKKTKGLLLTALLFLVSLRLLMGIRMAAGYAYSWLMEVVFGQSEPCNIAHFVIGLCVYAIGITLFIYFSYKWFIKK